MRIKKSTYYSHFPLNELDDVSVGIHEFLIAFFKKHKFLLKSRGVRHNTWIRIMKDKYNFRTSRQYIAMLEKGDRSCSVFFLGYVAHSHGMSLREFCDDIYTGEWCS